MIRGIIFDKDGTLFDFHCTWAGWTTRLLDRLSDGNASLGRQMAATIGFDPVAGFHPTSPVIAGTASQTATLLMQHLPGLSQRAIVAQMDQLAEDVHLAEVVPLGPLLQGLCAQGLRIGLVTNDSEAPARVHLAQAGITDFFDVIFGADSGPNPKPAPDALLAFAARCAIAPEEVVMVGDSLHDLHAGRAAGMRCVGVLTGLADHATLAPAADVVLPDIGALPDWLSAQST